VNTLILRRRGVRRKAARSELLAGPWLQHHHHHHHHHHHQHHCQDQELKDRNQDPPIAACLAVMPSPGLQMLSNGSNGNAAGRMDGTLSQSMDSVNTVAPEEEVSVNYIYQCHFQSYFIRFDCIIQPLSLPSSLPSSTGTRPRRNRRL